MPISHPPFELHAQTVPAPDGTAQTYYSYTLAAESGVPAQWCGRPRTTGCHTEAAAERFVRQRIEELKRGAPETRPWSSSSALLEDPERWHRSIPRQPFIPRGPKGSFDSVWLNLPTNPPIVNYNQLWFYYSGRAGGHGAQFPEAYGAIGLATLRIDGFCSLYGGEQPGALLTKPVTWPGASCW